MTIKSALYAAAILLGTTLSTSARGAVLIFTSVPSFPLNQAIPADYGDRIAGPTQLSGSNLYQYGLAGGITPNVVVDYFGAPTYWNTGYGDLIDIGFDKEGVGDGIFGIRLIADPGFTVSLDSFDLAGYTDQGPDYTINSVRILDAANNVLFAQSNVIVQGGPLPEHTDFDFTGIQSTALTIEINAANLVGATTADNIGLDNVQFSQAAPVP